ncbi:MAG: hypothetical protein IT560_03040 [Alphaproteobacteria bacterium]|nr:hypothetical protein [Alphaproteobacteria bacterium]
MSLDFHDRRDITDTVEASELRLKREIGDGFNRIAAALEALTVEIRGLREDLGPQALDKPAKLPKPKDATP